MGNQQNGGIQFCSRGELYTHRPEMISSKFDSDSRVGYSISVQPKFQVQRIEKPSQQVFPKQQQIQEKIEEIRMSQQSGSGKLKTSKNFFEIGNQAEDQYPKDDFVVFEGVFGNIIINMKGPVLYTDITGKQHSEYFDKDTIEKIFPMGISFGGFTRSIWFKDGVSRDEAFQLMISMPPSYKAVLDDPAKYDVVENEADELGDDDNRKIFEGLNKNNVIVSSNNRVLYTDLDDMQHFVIYNKRSLEKCFPNGICFGGLPKVIWFGDERERDLCFTKMQGNMNDDIDVTARESPACKNNKPVMDTPAKYDLVENQADELDDDDNMKVFKGINNNNVIVDSNHSVLYTDLQEKKHCVSYNIHSIEKCFPKGIHSGGLPKAIWFSDEMERDLCFMLMQWNINDDIDATPLEAPKKEYTGQYGGVVLHSDSQIEYTSLTGQHVKCYYEPNGILETFPMGIAFGRLPKVIWFPDVEERKKCIEAMRSM